MDYILTTDAHITFRSALNFLQSQISYIYGALLLFQFPQRNSGLHVKCESTRSGRISTRGSWQLVAKEICRYGTFCRYTFLGSLSYF